MSENKIFLTAAIVRTCEYFTFSKRIFRFLAVMMDGICAIPFIQWNLGRCNLDYIGTCIWWKGSVYCQPPFRFNGSIQSLLILVLIFLWRNFEQKIETNKKLSSSSFCWKWSVGWEPPCRLDGFIQTSQWLMRRTPRYLINLLKWQKGNKSLEE